MQRLFDTIKLHLPHALHKSANAGNFNLLRQILATSPKQINDYYGFQTPLHLACSASHYDCMLLLLKYGANVSAKTNFYRNWTPLQTAVKQGDVSAIRLLLMFGANPKIVDKEGNTSLSLCQDKLMVKRVLESTYVLYQRMTKYEKEAELASKPEQKALALQEVAKCWQEAAANETDPFLKLYYLYQALWYAKKAYKYQPLLQNQSFCSILLIQIKQIHLSSYQKISEFFDKNFLESIHTDNMTLDNDQKQFAYTL